MRPGEAVLGAYREAADLVEEMVTKLRDAWHQLIAAVQDLLTRAYHFLNTDSVWSTVVQTFTRDVADAIDGINLLISTIRPEVDKIFEVLRRAADRAAPVLSLFETAIACSDDVAERLSGLATEMTGSSEIEPWQGAAKRSYTKRAADQLGATEAAAAKVRVTARWLGTIGAANTAYVTNAGHLAAELAGEFVTAAIDAGETTPAGAPNFVSTLQRLAAFVDLSVQRTVDGAAELQNQFLAALAEANEIETDPGVHSWPAAAKMP